MLVEEAPTPVAALPITALRSHLRMASGFDLASDPAEDAALAGFLRAAIATVEARTGKVLLRRMFRLRLEEWRDRLGQPLPLAPVTEIAGISIEDRSGTAVAVPVSDWRLVADDHRPMVLPGATLLPLIPKGGAAIVRFKPGFADTWDRVPPDLAQAVLMMAAQFYEDRGGAGATRAGLPFGVSALLERWRAVRTLAGRGARP
ncbi:MAG: hypothetical protein DI498_09500 [Paracoccus denitrificans]|nr:MAG: hypothetical protein DI498_09500 [Paracoccus denitrificans]PZO84000.1 MAG: hypothetical protein DI633_09500 [Paracoccus denitrificans]